MGSSSPLPTHKFDYDKIINIILTIEKVIDNDELIFEGVSIWPLIRQQLWSNLQSTNKFEKVFVESVDEGDKNNSHKISMLSKLKRVNIFNVRHYKRYYEKYNSYNQCKSELLRIRNQIERSSNKYEKVVLLNSKAIYYQLNTEKGWVNVHIDPIYDIYKKANIPVHKIKFKPSDCVNNPLISSICCDVNIFREHYTKFHNNSTSASFEKRKKDLTAIMMKCHRRIEDVINEADGIYVNYIKVINEILFFSWYFDFIFKKIHKQIACIYTNCYYTAETMMLIHSAKKKNILTIDVQHGKQGCPHGMYTHWNNMPNEGYSTLPDIFLNWGEESARVINQSIPKIAISRHKAKSFGYPRISFHKQGLYKPMLSNSEEKFLAELDKYELIILFSIQPQNSIPAFVLKCLKMQTRNTIFLVRMHPNMKEAERQAIEKKLIEYDTKCYNINYATSIDLYTLIEKADIHITKWSSVCFEAAFFEVPTIIVSNIGEKMYKNQINSCQLMLATNVEELDDKIDAPNFVSNDYIIDDVNTSKYELLNTYEIGNR